MATNKDDAEFGAKYWADQAAQRWVKNQAELDRAIGPFGRAVLDRLELARFSRALDVGCGCGATTLELAGHVGAPAGSGSVVGLDVAPAMLDCARNRAREANVQNVSWVCADAATYSDELGFDLLFSRFGVMFFQDPAPAFENLRRMLRSNGTCAFVCWQELERNPWVQVPVAAATSVLNKGTLFEEGPGPFSLGSRTHLQQLLQSAGFDAVTIEPFEYDVVFSNAGLEAAVHFATTAGTAGRLLVDADEATRARVIEAMTPALAPHAKGQRVALPGAAWLVFAQRTR